MGKKFLFRAGAVLLGLLPLVLCEFALRGLGLGKPQDANDPFVGFSDIHPLFVLNEESGRYEIPKARQTHFQPESFPAKKAPNEFRIFVLGGSTVQGRPWSIESSFTTWLELHLNAADASRHYEVVNCGGVSYATYRLIPILQEVLHYQPDLVIFCEGHNEFLEDRSYAPIKARPAAVSWAIRRVSRLHTYNLLRQSVLSATAAAASSKEPPVVLGPEVDARLDWKGGMAEYHRDDQWQTDVIRHFESSLCRIVQIAKDASVPLLLVSPVSNLQYSPLKSEHRASITPAEQTEFDSLLEQASQLYSSDLPQAAEVLRRAVKIDPLYAQVHFELGNCLLEQGLHSQAREEFIQAKDLDVCPLRMLEPMKKIMHDVAEKTGTPLVDADVLIASKSRSGFPDRQWLVDHVHPTMSGHQLIADAIADKMEQLKMVHRAPDWEPAREMAYREHLASLDHVYFQRGKDRLRSEQGWAHGLAPAIRKK
ncbi:MAG TPA: tetratricopeptide repeat protein [Pirellulaceae bacterium]|jgi:tetratricopeptide (TPR) repeat protein